MFLGGYIVLVIGVAAISVADQDPFDTYTDYCTCMSNPAASKQRYDEAISGYLDYVKPITTANMASIGGKVDEMKQGVCGVDYFKRDMMDYADQMLLLCGGRPLRDLLFPVWKGNPDVDDETACHFISIDGALNARLIKNNLDALDKCDFIEKFEKVIYKAWKQCNKQCAEQE